ncbi:GTP cyclohydrolase FolE2 [Rahnella aceris]|jgi:GTP cyclohydrolase IB|uniref:GTP cyclohydrolase FolE2 n=2 Tax=Enterobacterales TaxID=91347 RepID=A0ABW6CMS5_RAHSY|nr:GTP cyclohydrolase folE2 [Raoultella terrigena]
MTLRKTLCPAMLPDVQSAKVASDAESLSWVGMEHIDLPVEIAGRPVSARVNAGINLLSSTDAEKGIHMSRLYLLLDELTQHEITPALLGTVLEGFLKSHRGRSDEASIDITGELLLSRKSLNSNHFGWKAYPIHLRAELNKGLTVTLKAGIPYSSTCPASAALSRHVAGLQFRSDFGNRIDRLPVEEVAEWLTDKGMPATPHSQRSWAWVTVWLHTDADSFPVNDVIDYAEIALGTAVQTVVKRSDEQAFAVANGQNLMFCEDAARRLSKAFHAAPFCEDFEIHVEHQESLHAHNAVARIYRKGTKNVT